MGNLPSHKDDSAPAIAGQKLWWPEINLPSEIRGKLEELCVLQKRVKDLRRDLFGFARKNGGFEHAGLYVFNLQTVTYEVPLPDYVAEAAIDLGEPLDLLKSAYYKISLRGWPGFVRGMPISKEILAMLGKYPDGGMTTVYGKPRIDVRGSAPDESKHIILQPKEKGAAAGWADRGGDEEEDE
jgi:hypothetical protein